MVGDGSRGAILESALSKLMASGHGPQIVAMSATSKRAGWGVGRFEGQDSSNPLKRCMCKVLMKRALIVMRSSVAECVVFPSAPRSGPVFSPAVPTSSMHTVGGLPALSDWLAARLFVTNYRPTPLTEHVVVSQTVYQKVGPGQS